MKNDTQSNIPTINQMENSKNDSESSMHQKLNNVIELRIGKYNSFQRHVGVSHNDSAWAITFGLCGFEKMDDGKNNNLRTLARHASGETKTICVFGRRIRRGWLRSGGSPRRKVLWGVEIWCFTLGRSGESTACSEGSQQVAFGKGSLSWADGGGAVH